MARFKMQLALQDQITVGVVAGTLASFLGLSTDDECLVEQVSIQNDTGNAQELYIGGVDALGAANVAAVKCLKIPVGLMAEFCAEDKVGDEDRVIVDIRQLSLLSPIAGALVNVAFITQTDVKYNG